MPVCWELGVTTMLPPQPVVSLKRFKVLPGASANLLSTSVSLWRIPPSSSHWWIICRYVFDGRASTCRCRVHCQTVHPHRESHMWFFDDYSLGRLSPALMVVVSTTTTVGFSSVHVPGKEYTVHRSIIWVCSIVVHAPVLYFKPEAEEWN